MIYKNSAGGVVYHDGQVLTISWQTKASIEFPKGGIEPGELAEKAALREVEEETGYRAQIIAPLGSISYEYSERGRRFSKTVNYFLMDIPANEKSVPRPHREPGEDFINLWLNVRQAESRLTHDDSRVILGRAVDVVNLLGEDDRRTVRYVDQVVEHLCERPDFVPIIVGCMLNHHRGLAMCAADALEKFSLLNTETLQLDADHLMAVLEKQPQKEVRWHLAQILPRLELNDDQLKRSLNIWNDDFYHSSSQLVRVASLQAVHDIAENYAPARKSLERMLDTALESGAASVKARARKLR